MPKASTPTITPTLIPPFAPPLRPDDVAVGVAEGVLVVVDIIIGVLTVMEEVVEVLLVLDCVEDMEEVDAGAARSTRNPGLESSPLFKLNVGEVILNRRTYLALIVRFPSGMAMVQAKFPDEVRLRPTVIAVVLAIRFICFMCARLLLSDFNIPVKR